MWCTESQKIDEIQIGELRALKQVNATIGSIDLDGSNLTSQKYTITVETNGKMLPIEAVRFPASVQPSKGTVVYLCGGPAECMSARSRNVPMEYDVVTFDYIGLGKNTLGPAPAALMSLENQGLATKKVIQALKLNNYVIYEQSFGTAVATVAAAYVGQDKSLKQPKSVILEGVSGARRFKDSSGYAKTASRAWELLLDLEKQQFKKSFKETKEALKDENGALDNYIIKELWEGPKATAKFMRNWMKGTTEQRVNAVRNALSQEFDNPSQFYKRMYLAAGCQSEPNEIDILHSKLFDGLMKNVYAEGGFCKCRTIHRDFDPKNFQIPVPILYINGEFDPATPLKIAKIHFDDQTSAPSKFFITVKDGGHFSSWRELASCTDELFSAGFSSDLKSLNSQQDFSKGCQSNKLFPYGDTPSTR